MSPLVMSQFIVYIFTFLKSNVTFWMLKISGFTVSYCKYLLMKITKLSKYVCYRGQIKWNFWLRIFNFTVSITDGRGVRGEKCWFFVKFCVSTKWMIPNYFRIKLYQSSKYRNSRSQMFFKMGNLKNFANFTKKHLFWCLF